MDGGAAYFRLSTYADKLLRTLRGPSPSFIGPASDGDEVVSFVSGGLRDLSICARRSTGCAGARPSRSRGVVWVDTLTNYLIGWLPRHVLELFRQFWPTDLHMVGKDIIRFRATGQAF